MYRRVFTHDGPKRLNIARSSSSFIAFASLSYPGGVSIWRLAVCFFYLMNKKGSIPGNPKRVKSLWRHICGKADFTG
jgi:hypothetical protein